MTICPPVFSYVPEKRESSELEDDTEIYQRMPLFVGARRWGARAGNTLASMHTGFGRRGEDELTSETERETGLPCCGAGGKCKRGRGSPAGDRGGGLTLPRVERHCMHRNTGGFGQHSNPSVFGPANPSGIYQAYVARPRNLCFHLGEGGTASGRSSTAVRYGVADQILLQHPPPPFRLQ